MTAALIWPQIASAAPEAPPKPLAAQAARLYPQSEALQREWMRAVTVVRRTRRGWLLDHPVTRRPA